LTPADAEYFKRFTGKQMFISGLQVLHEADCGRD
jgi:hypothetical protein